MSVNDRLSALAELAEAEVMFQFESGAPEDVRSALGMAQTRIGGGVALSMRHDPAGGYWNKALGFGFGEPVTAKTIAEVCDFYREQGRQQATIQIAPSRLPDDWDEICAAQGITPGSYWVQLTREVTDFPTVETTLRITEVDTSQAAQWASVLMRGFGMPEEGLAEMMAATVAHPDFRAYAAWDGDEMVAAANLFVHGEAGGISGASTLPTHRGRGAQSALLAARARGAAEAGCRWLTAQTGRPAEGDHNASLENMRRLGFQINYDRRNWVWQADVLA
ncbi:GNAT family N-acetyltransferase [Micromonospora sp. NPDC049523]|uniref:GNAT family N-acetyltransferase n=1 Tax=Micromonospora sp. NPDC049523 TaxID=3155921 RepID=UPI003422BBC1